MNGLGVIGNISIDTVHHPGGRRQEQLGGAALHIALAAARAGLSACPISVIGDDLSYIRTDLRFADIDLARVLTVSGRSCRFDITYDQAGNITHVTSTYGGADALTGHAMNTLAGWRFGHWHVCCRRPLNTRRILSGLVAAHLPFSVDFHLTSAAEQITAAAPSLPHATAVFVNATEYQVLNDLTDPYGLAAAVVTDGPREAKILRHGKQTATVTPEPSTASEPTGAGDTLTGTFLAATFLGADDQQALTAAASAATRHTRDAGLRHHRR